MRWWQRRAETFRTWWEVATDQWDGRAPKGAKRSSQWPAVRREHIRRHPTCAASGGTNHVRAHHVVPFHIDPTKELAADNLLTLCEAKRYGLNCHLLIGHLGNWRRWNPLVRVDAVRTFNKLHRVADVLAKQLQIWVSDDEG